MYLDLVDQDDAYPTFRTGCDCCLDSGLSCTAEVTVLDASVQLPPQQPQLLEQPPAISRRIPDLEKREKSPSPNFPVIFNDEEPLMPALKEWFDGWPERRKVWNSYSEAWGARYRRTFACGRHDFVNLVTIIGNPLG